MTDNGHPETLFENMRPRPLADRMRPMSIKDVVGQDHLMNPHSPLWQLLEGKSIVSAILWGPPGSGKTTIARLIADKSNYEFISISAVFSGVVELRKHFDKARKLTSTGVRTILFVDEIHRFNRAQQDAFLPVVENGLIILIGATTENPSFELNNALLSRCQVITLDRLNDNSLEKILTRAEKCEGQCLPLDSQARTALKEMSDGDGRYLLNMAELLFSMKSEKKLGFYELKKIIQARLPLYDKSQDGHYNLISALHKSIRGSDVDAGLYWFSRMIEGGEDPSYIARRLVRLSIEDIGLADPNALLHSLAAWDAYERLGSPEGDLALAQSIIYLASAPKSNASYVAFKESIKAAKDYGSEMPPKHILNAPTSFMESQGYSKGYEYDHDNQDGFSGQNYFPENIQRQQFYHPVSRGNEQYIKERLEYLDKLRKSKTNN
ncbi:MAG: AAA family ATPase [Rhodospirillaceae bacterium]|nr:AAA family ATPase [Rhodospirillaceae bacterium]|tara:strand:+ start:14115 stop:15425 length:1311 start_codon:yes stop_codon:yes gene_type:complete